MERINVRDKAMEKRNENTEIRERIPGKSEYNHGIKTTSALIIFYFLNSNICLLESAFLVEAASYTLCILCISVGYMHSLCPTGFLSL